jgi:hypothetical protein
MLKHIHRRPPIRINLRPNIINILQNPRRLRRLRSIRDEHINHNLLLLHFIPKASHLFIVRDINGHRQNPRLGPDFADMFLELGMSRLEHVGAASNTNYDGGFGFDEGVCDGETELLGTACDKDGLAFLAQFGAPWIDGRVDIVVDGVGEGCFGVGENVTEVVFHDVDLQEDVLMVKGFC